eukprot:snap_masked-scaffold_21-processed-gene-4.24-mRNA-1 protein AED:1.00 eAED:1.00 QI:0/-1/0/0/-1/1/1/0/117
MFLVSRSKLHRMLKALSGMYNAFTSNFIVGASLNEKHAIPEPALCVESTVCCNVVESGFSFLKNLLSLKMKTSLHESSPAKFSGSDVESELAKEKGSKLLCCDVLVIAADFLKDLCL